jgi:hypothetical protein
LGRRQQLVLINILIIFFSLLIILSFFKANSKIYSKERIKESERYFSGSLTNEFNDSSFGLTLHFKDGKYRFSKQTKLRPTYILSNL